MRTSEYIGARSPDDFERERIRLLRQGLDPVTIRRLESLGVEPGWRCLEVGAGDGSIAQWLAGRVGSDGHVVATDIEPRFLAGSTAGDSAAADIEVRRHDILTDELETSAFDLVHCRTLLMHLERPRLALERMSAALRPGGLLLVEETDYTPFGAADSDHPHAATFDRLTVAILDAIREAGVVDLGFGRRLRGLIEDLDLVDVGHEGLAHVRWTHESGGRYQRMNFTTLVRPHADPGAGLTDEDYDTLGSIFDDPTFAFVDRTFFSAWGARPA